MIEIMRKLFPVSVPALRPVKHFVFHAVEGSESLGAGIGEDLGVDVREKYTLRDEYLPNFAGWKNRAQFEIEFAKFFDAPGAADEIDEKRRV